MLKVLNLYSISLLSKIDNFKFNLDSIFMYNMIIHKIEDQNIEFR